jgi:hypothetical protein
MARADSLLAQARLFDVSFAWACGCAALHLAAASLLRPARFPRLARLSGSQMLSLHNQVVAATHAMTLFVAAVLHLAPRVSPAEAGVLLIPIKSVSPMEPAEAFWCCTMVGYLLYDMVIVVHGREGLDMLAHHALGLVSWGSLRLLDHGGIYIIWVHLAEVRLPVLRIAPFPCVDGASAQGSTPFLHLCTALHKLGLNDTLLFKLAGAATLALFTVTRAVASPLCLASLWTNRALWGEHTTLFGFNCAVTLFFVLLNYHWWFKLLRRAFGPSDGGKRRRTGPAPAGAAKRRD